MITDLTKTNEVYGTNFSLDDEVIVDRGGHKTPHHGRVVGAEEDSLNLRLVRDGEDRIYPAEYSPADCYVIGK